MRYVVVEAEGGRIVGRERITPDASRSFREASFTGDWRQLVLGDDDRRLFNTDTRDDARGDLMRELSRALTEQLSRSIYDSVLREVR